MAYPRTVFVVCMIGHILYSANGTASRLVRIIHIYSKLILTVMSLKTKLRAASHAGDWYSGDGKTLNSELTYWLQQAKFEESFPVTGCRAIIAPHAGYAYSGPVAAWAYKGVDTTGIKRVFILGPSHHYYLEGCALPSCDEYDTPIGKLPLDDEVIEELRKTGQFECLSDEADEDEHSIEMHLPYLRKIFEGKSIRIVPIIVGAISPSVEAKFGALLAPYLHNKESFCVVSSDFCHWGLRFSYTYYYPESAPGDLPAIKLSRDVGPHPGHPIYQSIKRLDQEAMATLTLSPSAAKAHTSFAHYLAKTKNTICGRHPIGVLLGSLSFLEEQYNSRPTIQWARYEQSNECKTIKDSSVSYASAWICF